MLKLTFYLPEDIVRGDRHAIVIEDGDELCRIHPKFDHHETAELGVAVLFYYKETFMRVDELSERSAERKCPGTHGVEFDSLFG
jgi:hypothetical protein